MLRFSDNGGDKGMEEIIIGAIAGAIAVGVFPFQGVFPKLF
jgi:hypothetical protein